MTAKEDIYKKTQINTSSPLLLLVMLYERAIQDLEIAEEFYQKEDPKSIVQADKKVYHAQDIITELMSTLNFEDGGDISRQLFSIYSFLNKELDRVILEKNRESIQEVIRHLKNLHAAWKETLSKDRDTCNKKLGINIVS
ncbi:flagellar export chaperone FliS [Borrelia sp. BU AG58]|uniref:flagellar export chaperone FliS n=1 Tax=Borrelia sp. BU AG58 TaxID=2887345 RepID=UPI001E617AD5|nr:flagellar export chaperone FliS [Borrelia sp. BU AG58]UER67713.1 flagellar export chaperone FliS [Borrelia sp. BU AG58]